MITFKRRIISMLYNDTDYKTLQQLYADRFSLNWFNTDAQNKMALIFLTCYVTDKMKAKNPDTTCWSVLYKLNKEAYVPDQLLMGLSIICEDYFKAGGEFPTFGLKGQAIVSKIQEILKTYLPF